MKQTITITMSDEALALIEQIKKREGLSRSGILEVLVREGARARGIASEKEEG